MNGSLYETHYERPILTVELAEVNREIERDSAIRRCRKAGIGVYENDDGTVTCGNIRPKTDAKGNAIGGWELMFPDDTEQYIYTV